MNDRTLITKFLSQQPLCVLSTINAETSIPESALVAFAETNALEIVFGTMVFSRKYSNLKKNSAISFVTGFDAVKYITLQYEGIASEAVGSEVEDYKNIILNKDTPCTEEFLSNKEFKMFKIRPTWISLSDYTQKPPRITELKF